MAELLDLLELRHAHAARLADASDVVAREIDEHRVLGALLAVRLELGGERCVLLVVPAAPARARDRVGEHLVARHLHEHLGRSADELDAAEVQIEHVGGRIDLAQSAVEVEARLRDRLAELARRHDLEDVAGEDMLLRLFDGGNKITGIAFILREEVERRPSLCSSFDGRRGGRAQPFCDRFHLPRRLLVHSSRRFRRNPRKIDESRRILQGIEDHQLAADHELPQKLIFIERHRAHAVEGRGDFVVQIAYHAAVRQRQLLVLHRRAEAFHIFFERFLRCAVEAFHQIVFADH